MTLKITLIEKERVMNTPNITTKTNGGKTNSNLVSTIQIGSPAWMDSIFPTSLVAPKVGIKQNQAYKEVKAAFAKAFEVLGKNLPQGYTGHGLVEGLRDLSLGIQDAFIFGDRKGTA